MEKPHVVAVAVQCVFLALFYADFLFGLGLPGTCFIAMSFLAWGFSIGWKRKSRKGGD